MDIYWEIREEIVNIVKEKYFVNEVTAEEIVVESPRNRDFGDISTNAAMVLAKIVKNNPTVIASEIASKINIDYVESISTVGGFINFKIKKQKWLSILESVLNLGSDFGYKKSHESENINIEYVSCNPTGPMHIGHVRGAVLGDVIANMLLLAGHKVTREFYINDTGNQITNLAKSVYLRYLEILDGSPKEFGKDLYKGEYLLPVARVIYESFGNTLDGKNEELCIKEIKITVVNEMMKLILLDLEKLDIKHDIFFSEQSLHKNGLIQESIELLKSKGLVYRGVLPTPKGIEIEDYEPKEQLLFKSTNFGDTQDRVVQKADNSYTYFSGDIGYAKSKINRGYKKLMMILGSDHIGYVKRFEAIISALSEGKVIAHIKTCNLVNFIKNGKSVKMSKRSGDFATAKDVIDLVGSDAIRFMMISSKPESPICFDLDLVKKQNKDNPIFYVQYAVVRANSAIKKAKENFTVAYKKFEKKEYDLNLLALREELELIKFISIWPKVFESSVKLLEPHKIPNYMHDLASMFHSMWNFGKGGTQYRLLVKDDNMTAARLALALSVQNVLSSGLRCIGIKPIFSM